MHSGLHLGVTIGAQKEALGGFRACALEAASYAVVREGESLGGRVEMVELQRALTRRVPTEVATAARLFDKFALHPSPPIDNALLSAPQTPVVAAALEAERGFAVPPARELNQGRALATISWTV